MKYVATFYTHVSAMMTHRTLKRNGLTSQMAPVPRALSSSCGTCVLYEADDPCFDLLDRDVEQVVLISGAEYTVLKKYQ